MVKSRFKVIENKSEVESLTNVEANELRYLNFELQDLNIHYKSF